MLVKNWCYLLLIYEEHIYVIFHVFKIHAVNVKIHRLHDLLFLKFNNPIMFIKISSINANVLQRLLRNHQVT